MTSEDCRAARARLGWSRYDLAVAARLDVKTLATFEEGRRRPREGTVIALRRALREAGVI